MGHVQHWEISSPEQSWSCSAFDSTHSSCCLMLTVQLEDSTALSTVAVSGYLWDPARWHHRTQAQRQVPFPHCCEATWSTELGHTNHGAASRNCSRGQVALNKVLPFFLKTLSPRNQTQPKSSQRTIQESEAPNNLTAKPLTTPNLGLPHTANSVLFSASKICFPKCSLLTNKTLQRSVRASQLCHRFVMELPKYFPTWASERRLENH